MKPIQSLLSSVANLGSPRTSTTDRQAGLRPGSRREHSRRQTGGTTRAAAMAILCVFSLFLSERALAGAKTNTRIGWTSVTVGSQTRAFPVPWGDCPTHLTFVTGPGVGIFGRVQLSQWPDYHIKSKLPGATVLVTVYGFLNHNQVVDSFSVVADENGVASFAYRVPSTWAVRWTDRYAVEMPIKLELLESATSKHSETLLYLHGGYYGR